MPPNQEGFISDVELVVRAKKELYDRSRLLPPDDTLASIQDLKKWITQELAFEEGASASFGRLLSDLWHAEYLDQLPPLLNRFERLVSAYFVRRGSIPAFHGFCSAWRDGVLRRVLQFAEEEPDLHDVVHPPAPFALLACGMLGRREQTLEEAKRFFLVWRGDDSPGYFEPFSYRILVILDNCGLIKKDAAFLGKVLWRGSLDHWIKSLEGDTPVSEGIPMDIVGDLRVVCGDETIGNEAVRQARRVLERSRGKGRFQAMARRIVDAPLALGILGGIKVEKSGEYAGCCNTELGGLYPLVSGVRLLAAHYGIEHAATLDRLTALGDLNVVPQAQVEHLKASYHVLAGHKVHQEIALKPPYLKLSDLSEEERMELRSSLESVRHLQRLLRCLFLGKERQRSPDRAKEK